MLGGKAGTRVNLVAQYGRNGTLRDFPTPADFFLELKRSLLDCARRAGLEIVDTGPTLRAVGQRSRDELAAGNRLVAETIADYLRRSTPQAAATAE